MFEFENDFHADDESSMVREDLFLDDEAREAWEWAIEDGTELSF